MFKAGFNNCRGAQALAYTYLGQQNNRTGNGQKGKTLSALYSSVSGSGIFLFLAYPNQNIPSVQHSLP